MPEYRIASCKHYRSENLYLGVDTAIREHLFSTGEGLSKWDRGRALNRLRSGFIAQLPDVVIANMHTYTEALRRNACFQS